MQTPTSTEGHRPTRDREASLGEGSPDPTLAVCTRELTKLYRSPWTLRITGGLEPLDFDLPRGEVLGLLGPNGAGKTTTLKLLTGLLRPTRGRAWLLGESIESDASRRRMGFLPEQPYFYDYLNGVEYLEFVGRLSGLLAAEAGVRARRWLGQVGLGDRPRTLLRKYSKGMLQRLGLAAALIHDPELVILDEPMTGLDPFGRRDVRELILEQRERGVSVLFSSHILPDVEMLCDRVVILHRGRLARTATVSELTREGRDRVEIRCAGTPLLEIPVVWRDVLTRMEHPEGTAFLLADDKRLNDVVQWLLKSGARLRGVTPQRATLEDLFLEVAGSSSAAHAGSDAHDSDHSSDHAHGDRERAASARERSA
jgi:ABC-2 type transport system ATP-binding protein